jgi:molybdopterin molybdotransferase
MIFLEIYRNSVSKMINPNEALNLIQGLIVPKNVQNIAIQDSLGLILAEDLKADRDFPPFNRAMMDGIAIKNIDLTKWAIEDIAFAGEPQKQLVHSDAAIEIMTGAPVPINCNSIIKIEDIRFVDEAGGKWAEYVGHDPIKQGQFIHVQAIDCKQNDLILSSGAKLGPVEIAIAATIGKTYLSVFKKPSIAIFSTGDEIVAIHEKPQAHQIRSSNSVMLESVLKSHGFSTTVAHMKDEKSVVEKSLESALEKHEILLLSGGVSAGKKDFIPEVLENLGFRPIFHKIAQKPGKPLYVGSRGDGQLVFAFPGNPISTLTCFWIYFLPWVLGNQLILSSIPVVNLPASNPKLDQWLPVKINAGQAETLKNNGSGDLIHWKFADGLVWQKAGSTEKSLPFFPLRS